MDPDDTLAYSISVRNTGSAPATDVRLSDTIPTDTSLVTGSVTSSQGAVITEDPVNVNLGTLGLAAARRSASETTVNGGTPDGTIIANQAIATANGDITAPSDDNGNLTDGKNPTLTPVGTGGSGAGSPTGLAKTLISNSETADSANANLMIGEVATFRVAVEMPAGTLHRQPSRTLPSGLTYVPRSARLARVFDTGLNASLNPGGINSEPSGDFVVLVDGSELVVDGQTLLPVAGSVINSDHRRGQRAVPAGIPGAGRKRRWQSGRNRARQQRGHALPERP